MATDAVLPPVAPEANENDAPMPDAAAVEPQAKEQKPRTPRSAAKAAKPVEGRPASDARPKRERKTVEVFVPEVPAVGIKKTEIKEVRAQAAPLGTRGCSRRRVRGAVRARMPGRGAGAGPGARQAQRGQATRLGLAWPAIHCPGGGG